MNLQDNIVKWILLVIIFCFAGVTIAILLLFLTLVFKYFGFSDGMNGGIIAAIGGIIGGSLTLFGVKWTLNKQNENHEELRKQEQEKKELSLRPYLRIVAINDKTSLNPHPLSYIPSFAHTVSFKRTGIRTCICTHKMMVSRMCLQTLLVMFTNYKFIL